MIFSFNFCSFIQLKHTCGTATRRVLLSSASIRSKQVFSRVAFAMSIEYEINFYEIDVAFFLAIKSHDSVGAHSRL